MFINFKNSFTSKLSDKLVVKQHITTEMLGYTTLWLISMHFLVSLVFWHSYISQGSVATCSWRGGICKKDFFANLLPTLAVKNFWKSINIWWSYGQEFSVCFFLTHSVGLDYGNALLANAPKIWTEKLQRFLNAAARVITGTRKFDSGLSHILHHDLHWLDVPHRVIFKLCITVYKCLHG